MPQYDDLPPKFPPPPQPNWPAAPDGFRQPDTFRLGRTGGPFAGS